jgi:hypothetical protein
MVYGAVNGSITRRWAPLRDIAAGGAPARCCKYFFAVRRSTHTQRRSRHTTHPAQTGREPPYIHPGEDGPEGFYRKLRVQLTGEKSEGQTVRVRDLTNA